MPCSRRVRRARAPPTRTAAPCRGSCVLQRVHAFAAAAPRRTAPGRARPTARARAAPRRRAAGEREPRGASAGDGRTARRARRCAGQRPGPCRERPAEHEQRRGDDHQQLVLHHVRREQMRAERVERRHQRGDQQQPAGRERDDARARARRGPRPRAARGARRRPRRARRSRARQTTTQGSKLHASGGGAPAASSACAMRRATGSAAADERKRDREAAASHARQLQAGSTSRPGSHIATITSDDSAPTRCRRARGSRAGALLALSLAVTPLPAGRRCRRCGARRATRSASRRARAPATPRPAMQQDSLLRAAQGVTSAKASTGERARGRARRAGRASTARSGSVVRAVDMPAPLCSAAPSR